MNFTSTGGKNRKEEKGKAYVCTQTLQSSQTSEALPLIMFSNMVIAPCGRHQLVLNPPPSKVSSIYLVPAPQTQQTCSDLNLNHGGDVQPLELSLLLNSVSFHLLHRLLQQQKSQPNSFNWKHSGTYRGGGMEISEVFSMNVSKVSQLWDSGGDPTQSHMCSIGPGNKTRGLK